MTAVSKKQSVSTSMNQTAIDFKAVYTQSKS